MTIQEVFNIAARHHQAGQLHEAEKLYRQILVQQPEHADSLHLLGVIAQQVGRNDVAIDLISKAVAKKPDPSAYCNLGTALAGAENFDAAIAAFRQAILLRPNYPDALTNLGNALRAKGQLDEAIAANRQAIALNSNYAAAYGNLGNVLLDKGLIDDAIASYRQFIHLNPNSPVALTNLGNALGFKGQLDEAIEAYRRAISLRADYAEGYANLGAVLTAAGRFDEAIAACKQAIALKPNYADAYGNLGNALNGKGELDESIAAYGQAISLKPNLPDVQMHLGNALLEIGRLDDAIAEYRKAITYRPAFWRAHSNLLMSMHYHPALDAEVIAEEHRRWNQVHAEPLKKFVKSRHGNVRDPQRRLRIGYCSADFRTHAVASLLIPLLANHDHQAFEIFCYSQVHNPDLTTAKIQSYSDHWRNTAGLPDEQMAEVIRQDQIDILVDLSGHTGIRLLVFARKPAPVQVTYLGYPDTTGLTAIDYRLSDTLTDPTGVTDSLHSEKIIRLPRTNWIFQAPDQSPPPEHHTVGDAITFGCFNTLSKITEPMLSVWAGIVTSVPGSRLLLKAKALGNPQTQKRWAEFLNRQGLDSSRFELRGHEAQLGGHLALYNQVDIALDPFPYHGTATTCEALWMGVPVITLAGQTHVSRVGVSLLTNAGLTELIAGSTEEYSKIAIELASDLSRLREYHSTLRQRLEQSPVMDARGFARDVEAAYREMWRKWCSENPVF